MSEDPGIVAGRYRIEPAKSSTQGSSAIVARDLRLNRRVVLEPLEGDENSVAARLAVTRSAAALDHPALARVFDVVRSADGAAFVVRDVPPNTTLPARLERGAPVALRLHWLSALTGAVLTVHGSGMALAEFSAASIRIADDDGLKLVASYISASPAAMGDDIARWVNVAREILGRDDGVPAVAALVEAAAGGDRSHADLRTIASELDVAITAHPPFSQATPPPRAGRKGGYGGRGGNPLLVSGCTR